MNNLTITVQLLDFGIGSNAILASAQSFLPKHLSFPSFALVIVYISHPYVINDLIMFLYILIIEVLGRLLDLLGLDSVYNR